MQSVKESVSVVLKAKDHVLLVKRNENLAAFPGYDAFPGGKIEDEDYAAKPNLAYPHLDAELIHCAFREIQEELSIDLNQEQEKIIGIEELQSFTTPPFNPKRFKNRTILVELKETLKFRPYSGELQSAHWRSFAEWRKLDSSGELLMVPPVRSIIQNEGQPLLIKKEYEQFEEMYAKTVFEIEPFKGFFQIPVPSNTIPPAVTTNCFRFGDLIIDPSPKDESVLKDLVTFLSQRSVKRIFITHHHGDHNQYLDKLAQALGAEVLMGEFTFNRLKNKYNIEDATIIESGDIIGKWIDEELKVMAVPGHDAGQLALYPTSHKFIIVGDLIQGVGTVVIPTDEGDMADYFKSLKKCIDMKPQYIIPSHGIAFGGTFYLEKTLDHRKQRELQIKQLHETGISPEGMLPIIYKGVDKRLYPLALENIKSHLIKIQSES